METKSKSGVTGVNWDSKRNIWVVQITVNYKNLNFGRYHSLDEAKIVCAKARSNLPNIETDKSLRGRRLKKAKENYTKNLDQCKERSRIYLKNNKTKYQKYGIDYRRSLREEILGAYGGQCVCCLEKNKTFLTIDHKCGNGRQHRESIRGHLYSWLKKNHFPQEDYQLLCFNCNCAKGFFGCCPHDILNFDKNNTQSLTQRAIRNREIKSQVIHHYGGKCECCGIDNIYFLTIDHVYSDGGEYRKNSKNSNIYAYIKRNNFPSDVFRILCYNCNTARFRSDDVCPHQENKNEQNHVSAEI